ncbi:hypothetical protein D6853_07780 [Butyrivibrio sp. X503]|uniref:hypothetical protein n=1 Tax=Butyrivibrio sp. X503 TaxID=2364878 RepID=UPI000EAA832C|nr:hypothetical protein [Butyrivibrio sp. X503]RKM55454.1 hypothetical protein D6853_07780 [Butyrivibrio sp. X503]
MDKIQVLDKKTQNALGSDAVQTQATPKESAGTNFVTRIKRGSWILLGVALAAGIFSSVMTTNVEVDTSAEAQEALDTRISENLGPGAKIADEDDGFIGDGYYVSVNTEEDYTYMYLWDYADEDADYVQIYVNGEAYSDPFMLTNEPAVFGVPIEGDVEIYGVKDGKNDGISYGVYFEDEQLSYFGGVTENDSDLYTIEKAE